MRVNAGLPFRLDPGKEGMDFGLSVLSSPTGTILPGTMCACSDRRHVRWIVIGAWQGSARPENAPRIRAWRLGDTPIGFGRCFFRLEPAALTGDASSIRCGQRAAGLGHHDLGPQLPARALRGDITMRAST